MPAETLKLEKLKVKVKDVYSLGDFVKILEEWLKDNGFVTEDDKPLKDNNQEALYSHKIGAGGSFLDLWIWWRTLRYPPGNNAKTYIRYRLNIDMHFLGDTGEVEVMHKGKKVKLNKGELEIELIPFVEVDYKNEWKKHGFLKLVDKIFRKHIYHEEIESHKRYYEGLLYKCHAMIKQYFKLESFIPEETVSQGPKGLS
ncbi:MAG TPA: hypothetical protein VKE88_00535 [Candidatus Nanoarchaeia archaeon]|nr:hypothetical protein [Candidatus Nanoarchaeia archaeon]